MGRLLVILVVSVLAWTSLAHAQAPAQAESKMAENLQRARALDQQGVKAYGDGRYNDAIRFFEEAYRLGGPPFELSNIAKCYVRLDQPERAAETFERYLSTPNLPAEDRKDATQQLEALKKRSSTLTITSSPSGATVAVDGKTETARTPTSITVAPGEHLVVVTLPKHVSYTKGIEARYGRAIIVDATLPQEVTGTSPEAPTKPRPSETSPAPEPASEPPFAVRAAVGVVFPRYGSIGGDPQVGGVLTGTARLGEVGSTTFGAGVMGFVAEDSWENSINAPMTVAPCGALRSPFRATALSFYGVGTAKWPIVTRLSAVVLAGIGVATYVADQVGGDVFAASCNVSPGARVSFTGGAQLEFELTRELRLTATPLNVQLQPAFSGVRRNPLDATGVWVRTMIGLGVGVDFP